ncbi:unnamed protein product [Rhodiola kirilowii]
MEEGRAKSSKATEKSKAGGGVGFDLLNGDLLHNILSRLPAPSFAQAACVNRSWNQVCSRVLSRPKFASSISLNPSLEDAVGEVVDRVLSTPIRPHFALVCVGLKFSLQRAHRLVHSRLGARIPIITSGARGIIGRDAISNQFKEVQWDEDELECRDDQRGICLFVGFIPGVRVDTLPFIRSGEVMLIQCLTVCLYSFLPFNVSTGLSEIFLVVRCQILSKRFIYLSEFH